MVDVDPDDPCRHEVDLRGTCGTGGDHLVNVRLDSVVGVLDQCERHLLVLDSSRIITREDVHQPQFHCIIMHRSVLHDA